MKLQSEIGSTGAGRRVALALCVLAATACTSRVEPALPSGTTTGGDAAVAPVALGAPPPWPVFVPGSIPPPDASPSPDPVPGDDGPPTGAVTGAPTAVVGAAAAVANLGPYFRRCYNRALHDDPTMKGTVRLTGKIGADGTVLHASWGSAAGLSPQLGDCLKRALLAQRFHPPDGGGATLVVPISLSPSR